VWWQAGGCALVVEGAFGPASTVAIDPTTTSDEWNGEVAGLGDWLTAHNTVERPQLIERDDATGIRDRFCTSDGRMAAIEPAHDVRYRGSTELRVPPGAVPDGGDYRLLVRFRGYAQPGDYIDRPLPDVVASVPVTVTDVDARASSAAAAVSAFQADPRLQPWLTSTIVPDRPDLTQSFATELSWWRGAWELWVWPHWDGNRGLRMRYDPTQKEVVDVRTVYLGKAPDDEPGAHEEGFEPDVLIPLPGR
jgi:hypothetical protein